MSAVEAIKSKEVSMESWATPVIPSTYYQSQLERFYQFTASHSTEVIYPECIDYVAYVKEGILNPWYTMSNDNY
jgi:hypothetical protein